MNEIIMFDSPEAAQPYTMKGWRSRDGCFYKDEHSARYAGCTHRPCRECGKPARKIYLICDTCIAEKEASQYWAMPEAEWDGNAVLYSETLDQYFISPERASYELADGQSVDDLRLVICEPNYARQIDEDFFCDELPEDGEAPPHVQEAIEQFNAAVADTILSWSPGKCRLKLEGQA